jgi:hypothetical protein
LSFRWRHLAAGHPPAFGRRIVNILLVDSDGAALPRPRINWSPNSALAIIVAVFFSFLGYAFHCVAAEERKKEKVVAAAQAADDALFDQLEAHAKAVADCPSHEMVVDEQRKAMREARQELAFIKSLDSIDSDYED